MKPSLRLLTILALGATAFVILAPVVPITANSSSVSSPSVGVLYIRDPTGTYVAHYLGNNTWAMSINDYDRLLSDPYTGIDSSNASSNGTMIIISLPPSEVGNNTEIPAVNTTSTLSEARSSLPALTFAVANKAHASISRYFLPFGGYLLRKYSVDY